MKKILSLTSEHFFRGIGTPYDVSMGLFEKAEGIDFLRAYGLLMSGYIATDLDSGGSVVGDKILWLLPYPETSKCYGYGRAGKIYSINMSTDAPTLLQTTSNSEGQGAEIYKDYLIYAQDTQVGKYGPLSGTPAFDDDGISGATQLTDLSNHQVSIGADGRCYVADGNELNSFSLIDGPPSSDWSTGDFVLPSDFNIVAHINDGRYHVIAATRYPGGLYGTREIKIFYWDYLDANTWVREYTIPEADISALKKKGDWVYVFSKWAIHKFSFSYSPQIVVTEGSGITNLYCEAKQGAVDEWKGHLLWGSSNGWMYGPPFPGFEPFLSNPLRIAAGGNADSDIYSMKVITLVKVYVGAGSASTNKLYAFKTGNSSATANTGVIDLGRPWDIKALRLIMQTAGSVTGSITNPAGTAIITDTITSSGLITARSTAKSVADQIIISLSISSAARIKKIEVFADRAADYA